jgi:uroporphyrinogen III methyltransferase/synthase
MNADEHGSAMNATVYLVGAGPGDPGLITVAGAEALRRADVVVYDMLANPELLKLCRADVERVYVGKSGAQHFRTQAEINAILVEKARAGAGLGEGADGREWVVVRLKGGDPYVFGRGGEEAEYLREHGVRFAEIPGVTAGIAAAAYAGIPATHRDFTSSITLVTGHERENVECEMRNAKMGEEARVNYEALAKLDGTLVFYMGVKSLPVITGKLMAAGMAGGTPVAVIRWGTRADQQTVVGTLETIAGEVQRAGIRAPAITVVGKVVSLRPGLNWFEERPLFGRRVVVTRSRQQASVLAEKLAGLGAQVIEAPTIEIVPPGDEEWVGIDRILQMIPAYDWVVFTSANGVRAAWERLRELTFDARHFGASHVAAIGPGTAEALKGIGIVPDLLPEKFVGEELAAALKGFMESQEDGGMRGKRVLLLRADIARPVLREELEKLGAVVEDVAIYRTVRAGRLPEEVAEVLGELDGREKGRGDWVTFTSASTAENLWKLLTAEQRAGVAGMKRASIGPVTSAAMRKLGGGEWAPTVEAAEHTIEGVVGAMLDEVGRA